MWRQRNGGYVVAARPRRVYDMIDRGELEHVRVSNAIRVVVR